MRPQRSRAPVPEGLGASQRRFAEGQPVIPVFLRPEHHGEDAIEDKPSPFRSESVEEEIQSGHALDLLIPRGGALPFVLPGTAAKPRALDHDEKDGPACPAMQNDVTHGATPAAQRFEAMIARLVNPSDPTPKKSPETPNVKSQAYFLRQPEMDGGKVSYDDCKRTSEPSPMIPDLRRGDMVDARNENRSFTYYYPSTKGFDEFAKQVVRQDSAAGSEGKGRRVFQCVGTAKDAAHLTVAFGRRVRRTFFRACHL